MTELLYLGDSYLKEFQARVTGVTEDGAVILDQTAFFPGGGGQPYDEGELEAGRQRWTVKARRKGFKFAEVGVHHYPRTAGTQTGANPRVVLKSLKDLFTLRRNLP